MSQISSDASKISAAENRRRRFYLLLVLLFLLVAVTSCIVGYILGQHSAGGKTGEIIDTIILSPTDTPKADPVPLSLSGRIYYTDGRPYANGTLELHSTPRTTTTDDNGAFFFYDVEAGSHVVSAKDNTGRTLAQLDVHLNKDGTETGALVQPSERGGYQLNTSADTLLVEVEIQLDESGNVMSMATGNQTSVLNDGRVVLPDGSVKAAGQVTVTPQGTSVFSDGTVNIPCDGVILTDGTYINKEGEVTLPNHKGSISTDGTVTLNDGTVISPGGTVTLPDGTVVDGNGAASLPDGIVRTGNGTLVLSDGTSIASDGTVTLPGGTVVDPDATVILPGNKVVTPDNTKVVLPDGTEIDLKDSSASLSDGTKVTPEGHVVAPDGTDTAPNGTVIMPDGTVIAPDGTRTPGGADTGETETKAPDTQGGSQTRPNPPAPNPPNNIPDTNTPPDTDPPDTDVPPDTDTPDTDVPPDTDTPDTDTPPDTDPPDTDVPPDTDTPDTDTPPETDETQPGESDEDYPGMVQVTENGISWEQLTFVNLFANSDSQVDGKLYPGVTGSYAFNIRNPQTYAIALNLTMSEADHKAGAIPLLYRLRSGDDYMAGDSDTWLSANELSNSDVVLPADSNMEYTLEWEWPYESGDDGLDTAIGTSDNLSHIISINLYLEQMKS